MKLVTFDDLGYLTLKVIRLLPFLASSNPAGIALADLDRLLRKGRRQRVEANLRLFDPTLEPSQLDSLLRAVFRDRWAGHADRLSTPEVHGKEHLRKALDRGRGVILWESPFGSRGCLHRTLTNEGISFVQVHGAEHGGSPSWLGQRLIRHMSRRAEREVVPEIIDIQEGGYTYLRTIKGRLDANRVVCMPGLGPKGRSFIRLDLLGRKESFATGIPSLALATGAALIPVYSFYDPSSRWTTVFEEPIPIDAGHDRRTFQEFAVKTYARKLESYVRRYPAQWRRWHAEPLAVGKPGLPAVTVDHSERPAHGAS